MAKKRSAKRRTRKQLDPALPIYQVKITLEYIHPAIWRRVQTNDCTLDELHQIIQVCMGWENAHLYAYVIDREQFGNPEFDGDFDYDSRFVHLSDLVTEGEFRFQYDYDFGDEWQHEINIEKTMPASRGVVYPRCTKGDRACPPEDSGGPYRYPYFLDALNDPDDEDHEYVLESVGGRFDPEELDLNLVNEQLGRLRRQLGRRQGKHAAESAFSVGDLVCVKQEVVHHRYPDIPLGGWVGKVKRIAWLTPVGYVVRWTKPTVDQVHPVFLKRCDRDESDHRVCWLDEDQLEKTTDETPAAMKQPTSIVTRPLSPNSSYDRVRMIFGLTSDDALPMDDEDTQRQFLNHLEVHLSFPFEAEYWRPAPNTEGGTVSVLGFADPPLDQEGAILCDVDSGEHRFQAPLLDLIVDEDNPVFQNIEDYEEWLNTVRDREEDEPEYPMAAIAYYGPDDTTTNRIVVGVFLERDSDPIVKKWVASDVLTDSRIREEIDSFLDEHDVQELAVSEENLGCPHEEGLDFPIGGDCPFCPFWKGRQGSGAEE